MRPARQNLQNPSVGGSPMYRRVERDTWARSPTTRARGDTFAPRGIAPSSKSGLSAIKYPPEVAFQNQAMVDISTRRSLIIEQDIIISGIGREGIIQLEVIDPRASKHLTVIHASFFRPSDWHLVPFYLGIPCRAFVELCHLSLIMGSLPCFSCNCALICIFN